MESFEEQEEYDENNNENNDQVPLLNLSMRIETTQKASYWSNHMILQISALLFGLFVVAEVIGAFISGSLSLLGDASAMTVDVLTYLANLYAEHLKYSNYHSPRMRRIIFDIIIPLSAVGTLLGVTLWITIAAINVIQQSPDKDDVPLSYLFGFSAANLVIDIICNFFFFTRGYEVFYHSHSHSHPSSLINTIQPHGTSLSMQSESNHQLMENHSSIIGMRDLDEIIPSFAVNHSNYHKQHHQHHQHHQLLHLNDDEEHQKITTEPFNSTVNPLADYDTLDNVNYLSVTANPAIRGNYVSIPLKKRWNLNMWSAFAHVSGDTIRTISVLSAAIISVLTGLDSSLCDAWAAVICSLTILGIAGVLIKELWRNSRLPLDENIPHVR